MGDEILHQNVIEIIAVDGKWTARIAKGEVEHTASSPIEALSGLTILLLGGAYIFDPTWTPAD
jgi:hypothetical protein